MLRRSPLLYMPLICPPSVSRTTEPLLPTTTLAAHHAYLGAGGAEPLLVDAPILTVVDKLRVAWLGLGLVLGLVLGLELGFGLGLGLGLGLG